MELKKYRNYLSFGVSIILFVITVSYSLVILVKWDNEVDSSEYSVEVSLPVIDWNSYSSLSKKYQD